MFNRVDNNFSNTVGSHLSESYQAAPSKYISSLLDIVQIDKVLFTQSNISNYLFAKSDLQNKIHGHSDIIPLSNKAIAEEKAHKIKVQVKNKRVRVSNDHDLALIDDMNDLTLKPTKRFVLNGSALKTCLDVEKITNIVSNGNDLIVNLQKYFTQISEEIIKETGENITMKMIQHYIMKIPNDELLSNVYANKNK